MPMVNSTAFRAANDSMTIHSIHIALTYNLKVSEKRSSSYQSFNF